MALSSCTAGWLTRDSLPPAQQGVDEIEEFSGGNHNQAEQAYVEREKRRWIRKRQRV